MPPTEPQATAPEPNFTPAEGVAPAEAAAPIIDSVPGFPAAPDVVAPTDPAAGTETVVNSANIAAGTVINDPANLAIMQAAADSMAGPAPVEPEVAASPGLITADQIPQGDAEPATEPEPVVPIIDSVPFATAPEEEDASALVVDAPEPLPSPSDSVVDVAAAPTTTPVAEPWTTTPTTMRETTTTTTWPTTTTSTVPPTTSTTSPYPGETVPPTTTVPETTTSAVPTTEVVPPATEAPAPLDPTSTAL